VLDAVGGARVGHPPARQRHIGYPGAVELKPDFLTQFPQRAVDDNAVIGADLAAGQSPLGVVAALAAELGAAVRGVGYDDRVSALADFDRCAGVGHVVSFLGSQSSTAAHAWWVLSGVCARTRQPAVRQ